MHTDFPLAPARLSAAAYLRCYPFDAWRMSPHRGAITIRAHELGLATPEFFFDNGLLSRDPLPELRRLLALVARGEYEFVLIPGPFVFSLDDREAARIVRQLGSHHCTVLELSACGGLMTQSATWAAEELRR